MNLNSIVMEDLENIVNEPIEWKKLYHSTVLITGVGGMIAAYLAYVLLYLNDTKDANIKVIGLIRNKEKAFRKFGVLLKREDFNLLVQDIHQTIEYNDTVDYVFHAANRPGPRQLEEDLVGTICSNTVGMMNILNFSAEKKIKGFLFLSTREIYGENISGKEYVTEDDHGVMDPAIVHSSYPESVRMSESLCISYRHQYGIDCKIARLANTYGPGMLLDDGRVVGELLKNIIHSEEVVIKGNTSTTLELTYLADTISGLFYLLCDFRDTVYNISKDNEPVTVKELAQGLCNIRNDNQMKVVINETDTTNKRSYQTHKFALLSSQKAVSEGWKPKINVMDGMIRTIESFVT